MRRSAMMVLAAVVTGLAMVLAGCGGGSGAGTPGNDDAVDTASVTGTVYAPAVVEGAAIEPADAETGEPVPNCPVEVVAERDRTRLASGTTDENGQFAFHGLPADVTAVIEAAIPGGARLMSRVQLRDGVCRANVDEDTTLVAFCAGFAYGLENAPDDEVLADEAAEACRRHQAQHGHGHGQAGPPDFADEEDVEETARGLLGQVAGDALQQAHGTRAEEDCQRAVRLMMAYLRARHQNEVRWRVQLVQRLIEGLREGAVTEEHAAQVLSRILEREVTAEQVNAALRYLWERLEMDAQDRDPEVVEVVAAVTICPDDLQALRIDDAAVLQQLADGLTGE